MGSTFPEGHTHTFAEFRRSDCMPSSRGLLRLLRLRELEEEQSRLELEAAASERDRAAQRVTATIAAQNRARGAVADSIAQLDRTGRQMASLELAVACRLRLPVETWLAAAEAAVDRLRDAYRLHRVDRRQVETLVDQARDKARTTEARRAQQQLDAWFAARASGDSRTPNIPAFPAAFNAPGSPLAAPATWIAQGPEALVAPVQARDRPGFENSPETEAGIGRFQNHPTPSEEYSDAQSE
jgi:flagellar export protein FliJ